VRHRVCHLCSEQPGVWKGGLPMPKTVIGDSGQLCRVSGEKLVIEQEQK
jgi:hypothetical protein